MVGYHTNRIRVIDDRGAWKLTNPQLRTATSLLLAPPRPNPTPAGTVLTLAAGHKPVQVEILDLSGRRLHQLWLAAAHAPRTLIWDGQLADGRQPASGVYYVRVGNEMQAETHRLVIVR